MQQTLASPGGGRVLTAQSPADRLYKVMRVLVVVLVFFLFIPSLNPARITELINRNMSLFTSGISYSQLTNGFSRAFRRGWVSEGTMRTLQFSALACCLGLIVQCGGMCATLGTTRLKRIGAWVTLGGGAAALAGLGCMFASYNTLAHNAYAADLGVRLPVTFFVILALVAAVTVCSAVVLAAGKKAEKGEKLDMAPKFQLFIMLLPFLLLCFLFGYLPLYGWRYAFFDYSAGDVLTMDKFVGFKWFTYLFQNEATRNDIIQVMKNTLGISGLGLATSWFSMIFAVFLAEIKNKRYRQLVQTFTTIPNFISWVIVFAVATAIFSTDGFISGLMMKAGVWDTGRNLLVNNTHVWLQMLLLGLGSGLIPLSTAIGMLKSVVSVILLFAANKISKKARGESII